MRFSSWRLKPGRVTPVVGSTTTAAAAGEPFALVNSPPTTTPAPLGSAASALTWPLRTGRKPGIQLPVTASKAAR